MGSPKLCVGRRRRGWQELKPSGFIYLNRLLSGFLKRYHKGSFKGCIGFRVSGSMCTLALKYQNWRYFKAKVCIVYWYVNPFKGRLISMTGDLQHFEKFQLGFPVASWLVWSQRWAQHESCITASFLRC